MSLSAQNKKIAYILSPKLLSESNRLPILSGRAYFVQDLINCYNLLKHDNITVFNSVDASLDDLKQFHSTAYLTLLERINYSDESEENSESESEKEEYGLNYDCSSFPGIFDYVKTISGGSLTGASLLANGACEIAINWFGGWHHAQRDSAEGFCYVNDIVLAIQKLTEKFGKILYVDLDIHHGNGVQNAFEFSKRILTLSLHKYSPGFYPGTGALHDIGVSKGKYYTVNVPFLEGISDSNYNKVFNKIYPKVVAAFKPDAIVVQCGADGLVGDKIGESNLTLKSPANCVQEILKCNLPTLFLGGGGYNFANTARLWAYLTGLIVGRDLDPNIPDSSEYFTEYGPTYELQIEESTMKDYNTECYLNKLISTVDTYCRIIGGF